MVARALLVAGLASPSWATLSLVDGESVALQLGGYARMFSAWQRVDRVPTPDLKQTIELPDPVETGLHASIVRAELKLTLGEHVTAEAHSRLQWTQGGGGLVGAGVTPTPERTVDTESTLVEATDASLAHDLDRAVLRLYFSAADISLGRQAITWGTSNLFRVSDVWTQLSPFDVDTTQKRGVDGARVVASFGDLELDAVVVDRGSVDDLSGGLRATGYLADMDVYVAAAKLWEQLAVMGGVSAEVGAVKLRGEALWAFYASDEAVDPGARATVGLDWFHSGDLIVGAEAHYNGNERDLVRLGRGELYLLETWYAGAFASWKPHDLVILSLSPMVELEGPTTLLSWSVTYDAAESVDLGVGGFHGVGDGLEFGVYPDVVYLSLGVFL